MEQPMQRYIDQLRAQTEEQRRVRDLEREADAKAKLAASIQTIKRTKPLEEQIMELMRTLPPQLRDRPWSMADLVQRLSGKYRDRPHAQQIGDALRRLGWHRERRYGLYEGVRVWIPNKPVA